jgi:hypothetical protein
MENGLDSQVELLEDVQMAKKQKTWIRISKDKVGKLCSELMENP